MIFEHCTECMRKRHWAIKRAIIFVIQGVVPDSSSGISPPINGQNSTVIKPPKHLGPPTAGVDPSDGVVGVAVAGVVAAVDGVGGGEECGGLVVEACAHQNEAEVFDGGPLVGAEPAVADGDGSGPGVWGVGGFGLSVFGVAGPRVDPLRVAAARHGGGGGDAALGVS